MPSKKKKYNARFPAGRIKKIMQTDEEVGKVAQAVPVIISRTLELFVESLLTKSLEVTQTRNAKTLSPSHVKQCILAESRFDFLRDLVKNIPDISQVEERESSQTWSTDSSPNACRYDSGAPLAGTSTVRRPRQTAKKDNGQSSDSGSDYEPVGKKPARSTYGNGRNLQRQATIRPDPRDDIPRVEQIRFTRIDTQNIPMSPFGNPPEPSTTVISTPPVNLSRDSKMNRLPNFYTETLKDEDDSVKDVKNSTVYSSVIQPNPEYSSHPMSAGIQGTPFGFYKQPNNESNASFGRSTSFNDVFIKSSERRASESNIRNVPKLHIDLTKGFPQNNAPCITVTENNLRNELPFTPTLIREPQTPSFKDRNNFAKISQKSDGSWIHGTSKKDPPPLQTLRRASSDVSKSTTFDVASPPKIHIDLTNIAALSNPGQTPQFHLDLSKYNFDAVLPQSPSVSTPKKKKPFISNEPPPLLPITPMQKTHTITTMNTNQAAPSTELQIDEDYDT